MKVSIVAPVLSGKGGTETVINKIVRSTAFIKHNILFHIFLAGSTYDKMWLDGLSQSVYTDVNVKNKFVKLFKLITFLINTDSDVVLILSTKLIVIAKYIKIIFRKKYKIVSWIHFSLFDEPEVHLNQLKQAEYHLAISTGINAQMQSVGVPEKNIFNVFNPISTNNKVIVPSKEKINLIFVGRITFNGQKNLKELIDGLSILENIEWSLDLYGDGEIEICKDYISELFPEKVNCFNWHGWVENPWSEINTGDALVLTSKFEGFPMVLLEAISRGLPCISANCPTGPNDIINSGINGELYKLGDIKDFSKKVKKIINTNYNVTNVKNSIESFYSSNYDEFFIKCLEGINADEK